MKNSGNEPEQEQQKIKNEEAREERIKETGQVLLEEGGEGAHIHLISIIGEIEGHENLSGSTKTTKYEHILPKLAEVEDDAGTVDGRPRPDQHGGRGCELRPGPGGDAGLPEQTDGIPCHRRQPFHRRSLWPWRRITPLSYSTGTMMVHPVRNVGHGDRRRNPDVSITSR